MADFSPTVSQSLAINEKGRSLLVSAAAGSGKTKVLTERLVSRICDKESPADIDSFLIITFTKAAAAELRGRITDEIAERLAADPDDRALRRQAALCRRAQIGTIHSFCQSILREYCHAAGLTPDFRVIEDDRAEAIRARVIERVMESRYEKAKNDEGFRLLVDTAGRGRDDRRLVSLVLNLHRRMQSHARPDKWALEQLRRLRLEGVSDASDTVWGSEILSDLRREAKYWAARMRELCTASEGDLTVYAAYGSSLSVTCECLDAFAAATEQGWDAAAAALPIEFPRLGGIKKTEAPELAEYVKAVRESCKAAVKGFAAQLPAGSDELLRDMRTVLPAMEALIKLTLDFDRAYAAEKRRRSELDFADLEHMAARLLTDDEGRPTDIARELSGRFTEIMIDEYQDVNRVQEDIFRAISRDGRNIFMVGDVKQSVYRFRLADPTLFTEKYRSFADIGLSSGGEPAKIMLRENFRSRREIIDAANHVFRCCMSERLGDIDYDADAELKCGAEYPDNVPVPELVLLALPPRSDDGDDPQKTELEAAYVAKRIRKLMSGKTRVFDGGTSRRMRWSDVAILMRSANSVGDIYRRELAKLGIPVASGQGRSFFASEEISFLMCLLAVIDNPRQDVPLIAVLRFPAFGFTADELSEIRASDKNADFFDALTKTAEKSEKCAGFLEKLGLFRSMAPDTELGELLWSIYDELDLTAICSAMSDGAARRDNLTLMIEYVKRFESGGGRGLRRFSEWLMRIAERGEEPGRGAEGDAVRIMTIHKSKGLEFPIVFLCDTSRLFNRRDTTETVLIHPELGLGPKITDAARGIEYPSLARIAVKKRAEREMLSEEMRLLYVALTRARERLIITGTLKDPYGRLAKLEETADMPMPPEILAGAGSMLTWLIYATLTDEDGKLSWCVEIPEAAKERRMKEAEPEHFEAEPGTVSEIRRRLSFSYAYADAQSLPSKITATELKHYDEPDGESEYLVKPERSHAFRKPELSTEEKRLTGAEKGTATHTVLQYIDYGKTDSGESIRSELLRLEQSEYISHRQAEAVDVKAIEKLFRSPLGKRILSADRIYRELKFSLLCPAEDYFDVKSGEKLLLQGVIDCCFEEEGKLVIVDYKTDSVYGAALSERAETYASQLRAYRAAAERMTGLPVKECLLYFLSAGECVKIKK